VRQERRRHAQWPGLSALFALAAAQPPLGGLTDRLLFAQANEAARYGPRFEPATIVRRLTAEGRHLED
jgi:hypothetical protein